MTIFSQYYGAMVSYAHNFIRSKIECEDMVQEVFISIWEKKPTFPNEASLKGYLYKSIRNKCYDSLKHKRIRETYAKNVLPDLQNDNIFMKQVLEEEIARELHQAIETLPIRKREIIKLSLRNIKNKDIANRLNIKLQTVKTLKSQAYKILREKFRDSTIIVNYLLFSIFRNPSQSKTDN